MRQAREMYRLNDNLLLATTLSSLYTAESRTAFDFKSWGVLRAREQNCPND